MTNKSTQVPCYMINNSTQVPLLYDQQEYSGPLLYDQQEYSGPLLTWPTRVHRSPVNITYKSTQVPC